MKRAVKIILSAVTTLPVYAAAAQTAPLAPTGLLTNELEHPLNVEQPTFGWLVNDSDYNEVQSAYEIVVTDDIDKHIVWNSGKVVSSAQSYVPYAGSALKPAHPYTWKVRTWDKTDAASPYSVESHFATGLATEDWAAAWISSGTSSANHFWYARYEKKLSKPKAVRAVLAHIACMHDYELHVNGTYIGRGQSFDYMSESRYQGWDITDAVTGNTLVLGLLCRYYGAGQGRAPGKEALLAHVTVHYADGSTETVVTGGDWRVSSAVPFYGSTKRNGEGDFVEEYDATKAQQDFARSGFDDSAWKNANVLGMHPTADFVQVTPELFHVTDDFVHPISVTKFSDGTTVADFGMVIPARPVINFKKGKAGQKLTIQAGYVLDEDGAIRTAGRYTQSTKMTYIYTQKKGKQVYNAWDHLAFRYLAIPSCGEKFTTKTIAARIVHTAVPIGRDSTLRTSSAMLDDVYALMKRSALYSIQNSFVDTPTREKGQFLQDAINISEASVATQYERAASKKAIEQFMASSDRYWTGAEAGHYNSVYPNGDGKRDIPDFSLNFPYWVWHYYMQTGDKALLEKAYPYIKATADYISRAVNESTGLVTKLAGGNGSPKSYQYGIVDWPAVGRFGYDWNGTKEGARTTVNMLSKRAFDVVALAADAFGHADDAADMRARSAALVSAINAALITADGRYCDGLDANGQPVRHISQHANSYALAFGIVPDEQRAAVTEFVIKSGMRQGPMTADILLKALLAAGKPREALALLTNAEDNGWAKEVANGYTFTWEGWDADNSANENSQSHGWGATAAADILAGFAGVCVLDPGAETVQISPAYCPLTSLEAQVATERGFISVCYERSEQAWNVAVTVPANITARVVFPVIGSGRFVEKNRRASSESTDDTQVFVIGSGKYQFAYDGTITVLP